MSGLARSLCQLLACSCLALSLPSCAPDATPAEAPSAAPPAEPPPAAQEAVPPPDRTFTVLACGDILLSRAPGERAAERGYRYLFEGVRALVSEADVAFANLESPAAYVGAPYPGKPPGVTFRADPATLFGVAWAGFDVLSLANNHMNDYGPRALGETLDFIDALGMERCGAGRGLEEATRPAVIDVGGARFAFLAYAEPIWSAVVARRAAGEIAASRAEERLHGPLPPPEPPRDPDSAGSSTAGIASASFAGILADIRRVRSVLAPDYLFVSVHWGDEHQHIPNSFQMTLGRAVIDAGATAVLGHHPHVFQSIEKYGDGLIAYSLGNFVFDMIADHTYESAALRFVLEGGAIKRVDVIPIRIPRGLYAPSPATGKDAAARLDDIRRWSGRFDTDIVKEGSVGRVFF